MTHEQILTKTVERVVANGWAAYQEVDKYPANVTWNYAGSLSIKVYAKSGALLKSDQISLFDHDFAKALWGSPDGWSYDGLERWEYHLQEMAVADDPIKYLGEHLMAVGEADEKAESVLDSRGGVCSVAMMYQDVKKGDMLFVPTAGVSYRATETCVIDKQEPNAIVLLRAGDKPRVFSAQEFDEAGFTKLTATVIEQDYNAHEEQ